MSPDHIAELVTIDLYRLATETLARHMVLAAEFGTDEHVAAYRNELARREANPKLERMSFRAIEQFQKGGAL